MIAIGMGSERKWKDARCSELHNKYSGDKYGSLVDALEEVERDSVFGAVLEKGDLENKGALRVMLGKKDDGQTIAYSRFGKVFTVSERSRGGKRPSVTGDARRVSAAIHDREAGKKFQEAILDYIVGVDKIS
jgi:hypothetical protein